MASLNSTNKYTEESLIFEHVGKFDQTMAFEVKQAEYSTENHQKSFPEDNNERYGPYSSQRKGHGDMLHPVGDW
jgi:hypothetical protein